MCRHARGASAGRILSVLEPGLWHVVLAWQALNEMPDDYTVFLHLRDGQRRIGRTLTRCRVPVTIRRLSGCVERSSWTRPRRSPAVRRTPSRRGRDQRAPADVPFRPYRASLSGVEGLPLPLPRTGSARGLVAGHQRNLDDDIALEDIKVDDPADTAIGPDPT